MTQSLAVIAIFIARGNLKDALREQVLHGVLNVTWMTPIRYRGSQSRDQANLPINASQQHWPQIR
jgi:hypothetical protein